MGQRSVWFDEDGDSLAVTVADKRGQFRDLGDGIFERINEKLGPPRARTSSQPSQETPADGC